MRIASSKIKLYTNILGNKYPNINQITDCVIQALLVLIDSRQAFDKLTVGLA